MFMQDSSENDWKQNDLTGQVTGDHKNCKLQLCILCIYMAWQVCQEVVKHLSTEKNHLFRNNGEPWQNIQFVRRESSVNIFYQESNVPALHIIKGSFLNVAVKNIVCLCLLPWRELENSSSGGPGWTVISLRAYLVPSTIGWAVEKSRRFIHKTLGLMQEHFWILYPNFSHFLCMKVLYKHAKSDSTNALNFRKSV